ncbi:MAG: hypothetical protein JNM17_38710 [Archangium sp.]|nr:hypothetical protein [Archangium sp.]
MTLALVAVLLSTAPSAPPSLAPSLASSHLASTPGMLLDTVEGARGGRIFAGVRLTVAGSICSIIGLASGAGGTYALITSGSQTGNAQTVSQVLGWTFFGVGALFLVIGLPLLIVGIANIATPPGVGLTVTREGQLAVTF